jgi:glycogen(starch) synthase
MKILHILYQSLPQISGSSIRSRDILMSQKEIGLDVIAVTSPFQNGIKNEECIDGITYFRTSIQDENTISDNPKGLFKRIFRFLKIIPFSFKLKKLIIAEEPQILHAHAMFFCGLPAIYYGWKYRIPVVYEVRSLWMLSKANFKKTSSKILIERLLFQLELYVMKKVSMVIAINDNLKEELVLNGIPKEKIEVIKNAVNVTLINNLKANNKKTNSSNRINFGYIGTLTPHEGIDFLIDAFKDVNSIYPEAKLLIYGSGIESKSIKKLASEVKGVEFYGSVNPNEIYQAFSLIDVIVNPRYKNKLTDSVTPLKPLEAMAYEKLVIGSDVGGIKELITHNENGFLFKAGDKKSLVATMVNVIKLDFRRQELFKSKGRSYVINEKSWLTNANKYQNIYNSMIRARN